MIISKLIEKLKPVGILYVIGSSIFFNMIIIISFFETTYDAMDLHYKKIAYILLSVIIVLLIIIISALVLCGIIWVADHSIVNYDINEPKARVLDIIWEKLKISKLFNMVLSAIIVLFTFTLIMYFALIQFNIDIDLYKKTKYEEEYNIEENDKNIIEDGVYYGKDN